MKQWTKVLLGCLTMLLAACVGNGSSDWETLRDEANELYNQSRFEEAKQAYERAMQEGNPTEEGRLYLRQDIIDCHLAMGEPTEARQLLKVQMEEAHRTGNAYVEAEVKFALGEQLREAGDKEKSYAYVREAIELMERCDDADAVNTLTYYHYRMALWLGKDKRYSEAIAQTGGVEKWWKETTDTAAVKRMWQGALATRAYLYVKTDSLTLADEAYRQWQTLQPFSVLTENDICPYLMERGLYEPALDIYERYEQFVQKKEGRWSNQMWVLKNNEANIYARMDSGNRAYQLMLEAKEIKDTLQARQAEENAQQLEAIYQNQQKTEEISRQRIWIVSLAAVLAIVLVALGGQVAVRTIRRRKDRAMAEVIREMAANAAEVTSQQREQEKDTAGEDTTAKATDDAPRADRCRFSAFDAAVCQGHLYLKPEVTRDVLMGIMAVNSQTFSRIIREQSGCQNLSEYINRKRIDHACQLMEKYPNWTMEAIAHECGYNNVRTFNTQFKKWRGKTPSDYQQQTGKPENRAF
ncbi:MAG: AraC family transcriptional regulator [Bacteroidaceae bacterium]|nr:AraC family transcriptional regulator [Bacteroidaceae bacterium]